MKTIEERKEALLTVKKRIKNVPYSWKEISLAVEGSFTNLRIWIGNETSIANGCGRKMIYMRLDCLNQYSSPFSKDNYLTKNNDPIDKLLEFYVFGQTTIDDLDKVLEITKGMKYRECRNW